MRSLKLKRIYFQEKQTLGKLSVCEGLTILFTCFTVELPWLNNVRLVSCIPPGKYKVTKRNSKKYGLHFYILNVPGRDMILIHSANFSRQLLGCIAPGDNHTDIDKDGLQDVTNSKNTLKKLIELMPDEFEIEIS